MRRSFGVDAVLYLAGAVCLGMFLALHLTGSGRQSSELGRLEVATEARGRQFLAERGGQLEGLLPVQRFDLNNDLLDHLRNVLTPDQANAAYVREITPVQLTIGWGGPREGSKSIDAREQRYTFTVDGLGRIQGFRLPPADLPPSEMLEEAAVDREALEFLRDVLGIDASTLDSQPEAGQSGKSLERLHSLKWEGADPAVPGAILTVTLELRGARPVSFKREYVLTPEIHESLDREGDLVRYLPFGGMFLLLGLACLVFVGRARRDEIDFRLGLIAGGAMFLAFVLGQGPIFAISPGMRGIVWVFITFVNALLFGLLMVPLFASAESLAREHWPEKLATLDYLLSGHFFSRSVGRSISQASALAMVFLAFNEAAERWLVPAGGGIVVPDEMVLLLLRTAFPGVALLGLVWVSAILAEGGTRFFLTTWLRPRLRGDVRLWIVATLLAFGQSIQAFSDVRPLSAGLALAFAFSLGLTWVFIRTELITTLWAHVVIGLLPPALDMLCMGGRHTTPGAGVLGFVVTVAGLGVLALLRPLPPRERAYVPEYVSKIRQRERMQHELELARRAQQGILPRSVPSIRGFDIATICVPAMEVGGDYYDFLQTGPRRVAVVVGDVSGKGIRAAFYMTLAKGMLLSLSQAGRSPREVLSRLNDLFFGQVERGVFLSMVYGEFDLDENTLTLARAGHNPLISLRGGSGDYTEIAPQGMALGLVRGRIFDDSIEDKRIPVRLGDVFVFYTDGFTEAMNEHREEFGEERMCNVLMRHSSGEAQEQLRQVNRAIEEFVAGTPQHDDMTMVLVRITELGPIFQGDAG